MAGIHDEEKAIRLEDFINRSRRGDKTSLEVQLTKRDLIQQVPPQHATGMKAERELYFLAADFLFGAGGSIVTISKVYAYGMPGEPETVEQTNRSIANERLKMDYRRLKDAGIAFQQRYF